MTDDRRRLLAQLAAGPRAMNACALAEALGWDQAYVECELAPLVKGGHVRTERVMAQRGARWLLFRITDRGRDEAGTGAQLRMDGAPDRPPMPTQPALF